MGLCHGNQGPSAGSLPATPPQAGGLWELLGQGHTDPQQDAADPGKVHCYVPTAAARPRQAHPSFGQGSVSQVLHWPS